MFQQMVWFGFVPEVADLPSIREQAGLVDFGLPWFSKAKESVWLFWLPHPIASWPYGYQ